jgi:hypothetical protein
MSSGFSSESTPASRMARCTWGGGELRQGLLVHAAGGEQVGVVHLVRVVPLGAPARRQAVLDHGARGVLDGHAEAQPLELDLAGPTDEPQHGTPREHHARCDLELAVPEQPAGVVLLPFVRHG